MIIYLIGVVIAWILIGYFNNKSQDNLHYLFSLFSWFFVLFFIILITVWVVTDININIDKYKIKYKKINKMLIFMKKIIDYVGNLPKTIFSKFKLILVLIVFSSCNYIPTGHTINEPYIVLGIEEYYSTAFCRYYVDNKTNYLDVKNEMVIIDSIGKWKINDTIRIYIK